MQAMFYDCSSLLYLFINKFNTSKLSNSVKCSDIFQNCNNSIKYCFKENINSASCQITNTANENCSHECFHNNSKYNIENNQCIFNCSHSPKLYEYNNFCYSSCPYGTSIKENLCENDLLCSDYYNYEKTECIEEIPKGYYCNDTINKTIDLCNEKCRTCSIESIKNNNTYLSCNNNESYYPKYNETNDFIECYNGRLENYFLED